MVKIKLLKSKLTKESLSTLYNLREAKSFCVYSCTENTRTLNSLYQKDLIKRVRYANGEYWELTDEGFLELDRCDAYKIQKDYQQTTSNNEE